MVAPLTFSLDLEDHRIDREAPRRYPEMMRRVLDFLDEIDVQGTVFVVGEVAEAAPDLIKDVAGRGHEIAFHAYRHRPLTQVTEAQFETDTAAGKALLEDLTGRAVVGFRAPFFSLTKQTAWAVETLQKLGFTYSSSVLPARHPFYGFPNAPTDPFKWPCGLIELPLPLARLGPWRIPYLGGIYLRYLPTPIITRLRARAPGTQALWTYCHPYDFDADEPFSRIKGTPYWASVLLWLNRRQSFQKMAVLLADDPAPPFAVQVEAGVFDGCPVADPAA